jgi:hypothetical protein
MRALIVVTFGPTLLCASGAFLAHAEEGTTGQSTPSQEKAVTLVCQLGDAEYTVRKQVYQELARLGRAAEAALEHGLQDDDAEVRRQCGRLLALARRSEAEAALDAFLKASDDRLLQKLPAWPRFSKLFGTGPDAQALFVEMHTAELPLLETLDKNPREVGAQMTARCLQLQQLMAQARVPGTSAAERGTAAALLFLATDDRVTTGFNAGNILCSLLYQPGPTQWLKDSAGARRLLVALAEKQGDPTTQQQLLYLFGNLRLREGLDWTVQVVRARETQEFNRGLAMSLIGCLGGEEHLAVLEPLLSNTAQVTRIHFGRGQSEVQVRDVALAMIIQLHGQDPGAFGFNDIRMQGATNPVPGARPYYWPYYCGFADNSARDAAFQKWKEHTAKHKGKG